MDEKERTYWNVIEPIWRQVDIYRDSKEFFKSVADIPRAILIVYAAHFFLSEVRNGGFLQFFWNSTGVLGPEALEGFTAIRMPELASLVQMANEKLGESYPRDRRERQSALLNASGHSDEELEEIFKNSVNFYLCYVKATKSIGFNALEKRVWLLADEENGGFDQAANRFFREQGLLS